MASFTTCCGGWLLTEELSDNPKTGDEPAGPLPRPSLKLTGIFVAALLAGLAVGWLLDSDSSPEVARVGERAPDFTVALLDGGTFTLSEQLEADDRPIVLNLWASWCGPCRASLPDLDEVYKKYKDNEKVQFLAVSVDVPQVPNADLSKMFEQLGVSVPIVRDKENTAGAALRSSAFPPCSC